MGWLTRIEEKLRDSISPATWFWFRYQRAQLLRRFRKSLGSSAYEQKLAAAKKPSGDLNVIVFDALIPMPDRDAGSARMALILKALTQLGRPAIISLSSDRYPVYEGGLRDEGIEVASWIDYRRILKSRKFQVALLSRHSTAAALLPSLQRIAPHIKIIFDTVDINFVRLEREYQLTGEKLIAQAARRHKKIETHLARESDLVWCVTRSDKDRLAAEAPSARFEIVPTIHPLQNRGRGFAEREGLVFIGNFLHRPNTDAIHYFMQQIYSLVRERIPEIKLFIVGDHAPPELQNYASDSVTLTGYVADVDSIFHNCRSMIAPLRFGSGMKGKIGQALSYGLPVVTTSIGAEGMGLENGQEVMIADDAREFAAALIRLYQDATLWQKLSDHGYNHIARHFTPEVVTETVSRSIRSLASDRV